MADHVYDTEMHTTGTDQNLKALVVDDSTVVRRLMDLILRPMDIALEFADNGEDAVILTKIHHYDVVFLDVMLPGIDGYRVCKTIKGNRRTRQMPIIMLTNRNTKFDKIRGIMSGSDVYLTKPLDRLELIEAINRCVPGANLSLSLSSTSVSERTKSGLGRQPPRRMQIIQNT